MSLRPSRSTSSFPVFLSDSPAQSKLRSHLTTEMKSKIKDPALEHILIPTTGVGCRRPTPGINYLSALRAPNVTIAYGTIAKITAHGAISASDPDSHHDLDVLICATGFETTYTPRFPIINGVGLNLQEKWSPDKGRPAAYFTTAVPDYPNYMMFFGPGNPWASGSFLAMIEAQAEYILKLIDRYQSENWHSFAPKTEVVDELMVYSTKVLKKTVWAENCSSWYKQGNKRSADSKLDDDDKDAARQAAAESLTIWPGSGPHFIEAMAELRSEDWDIKCRGNRFEWLGNGFSRTECDPDSDKAWYIRQRDEGPLLSREKRRKVRTRKGECGVWGMAI